MPRHSHGNPKGTHNGLLMVLLLVFGVVAIGYGVSGFLGYGLPALSSVSSSNQVTLSGTYYVFYARAACVTQIITSGTVVACPQNIMSLPALQVFNPPILAACPMNTVSAPYWCTAPYKPYSTYALRSSSGVLYLNLPNATAVTIQGALTVPSILAYSTFDGDILVTSAASFSCQSGVVITITPNNPYCSVTTYYGTVTYGQGCFAAGGVVCTGVGTAITGTLVTPTITTITTSSTTACTSTVTVTLTSGIPPPPLALPVNGSCYVFVYGSQNSFWQSLASILIGFTSIGVAFVVRRY